jgi:hypothetical protein
MDVEELENIYKEICHGHDIFPADFPNGFRHVQRAIAAYNGDINAAKVLHDFYLPGWWYNVAPNYCHVMPKRDNGDQEALTGFDQDEAKARLKAILLALIAIAKGEVSLT